MYDRGISREGGVLDAAVELDIVEKRGSYYSYGETRLGQGRENVKNLLREDGELLDEIERRVREAYGLPVKAVANLAAAGDKGKDEDED